MHHQSTPECANYARHVEPALTHHARMDSSWFKARLKEVGKTQQNLADAIGRERSVVTKILGGSGVRTLLENAAAFAKVLDVPVAEVLSRAGVLVDPGKSAAPEAEKTDALQIVYVRGEVEAGAWREAYEWPQDDWFRVPIPPSPYPVNDLFALRVRGVSMDLVYPDGSYVICMPLWKVGRQIKSGDRVVVERHRSGLVEATIKEVEILGGGRVLLWPRSSSPTHQQPIELTETNLFGYGLAEGAVTFFQSGLEETHADVVVSALVVGKFGWE